MNILNLLKKEVSIRKIVINNATIDLYKDKNGVSNSNIFRLKKTKTKNNTTAYLNEVVLNNVNFISENQQRNKLFSFEIKSLKSRIQYSSEGRKTDVRLKTFAKILEFNTQNGSFVKDKEINGKLPVDFSKIQNRISVVTEKLNIGGDSFEIGTHFNPGKDDALFDIVINTNILWRNAVNFLNLYYDAPEKMTVNWKIYSPCLDIKQIISVLSSKNQSSDQLQEVFSKSKANVDLLVDKLSYKKCWETNFKSILH